MSSPIRPWRLRATLLLIACAALSGPAAAAASHRGHARWAPSASRTGAAPKMYWGAWIVNSAGQAPWSAAALARFEHNAGKPVSLINWSSPFYNAGYCAGYCQFYPGDFERVRDHGSIPFFSWNPGPGTGAFSPAAIAAGRQDAYITTWAKGAKAWGHPFFLRFAWEMNAGWFPWGAGPGGTSPATFIAMWRHVHRIFTSVGARNVTWVWCPNVDPQGSYAPLASVYPGDAYVDWTCLDGYNGNDPFQSFTSLFSSSYDTITRVVAPAKPMLIGETGSTEAGGAKARWITELFAALPVRFPKVRGLLWFDKVDAGPGGHSDWPIESSETATRAFARGVSRPSYLPNVFASLDASQIPVP